MGLSSKIGNSSKIRFPTEFAFADSEIVGSKGGEISVMVQCKGPYLDGLKTDKTHFSKC